MYQGPMCLIKSLNADLLRRPLKNRVVDRHVVLDLVNRNDQRQVPNQVCQTARKQKAIYVAPIAEVDLGFDWAALARPR